MEQTKKCKKCGEVKPLDEFYKYKRMKDGHFNKCKECCLKDQQEYEQSDKGKKVKQKYNQSDKGKKAQQKYRQSDKGKKALQEYRQSDKGKKTQQKALQKYFQSDKGKKTIQEYRQSDKGKEVKKAHQANRRAMKSALPHSNSSDEWLEVVQKYDNKCPVTGSDEFDFEHFMSLNWGHGGSLKNNIYPLEHSLNIRKSTKNPFKWIKELTPQQQDKYRKVIHNLAEENGLTYKEFEQFVNWCEKNKRTVEQVKADNERGLTSIDLWKQSLK